MDPQEPSPPPPDEPDIHALLYSSRPPSTGSLNPASAFAKLQTPQDKANFWKIIGMLGAAVLVWLVVSAVLAVFPWWIIPILAVGLAGYLWFRSWRIEQRQWLIDTGHCGQCGYDLRGEPVVCPECGRDAHLDEPTWRKLKREHAERAKIMQKMTRPPATPPPVKPAIVAAPKPVIPDDAPPPRKPVFRPPVDLAPIPVEGDE